METVGKLPNQGGPIKLLHEAAGFIVEVELISGDRYHGNLKMIEDNMNLWIHDVVHTSPNGKKTKIDVVFIRGSNILFIICPEMFSNSKLFKTGESDFESKEKPKGKVKRTFSAVKVKRNSH